jgi:hypothetical protein
MVASRTDKRVDGFDQYHCLQCGTVIRFDDNGRSNRIDTGDEGLP